MAAGAGKLKWKESPKFALAIELVDKLDHFRDFKPMCV